MRRTDRERDARFALELFSRCEYATLATVNADGTPYCIPVSPAVAEANIYFHCALEGKKLENIKNNTAVCLSCVGGTRLVPEEFSTEYESAVAAGRCELVTNEDEKRMALRAICEKYAESNMGSFESTVARSLHRTAICKITAEALTGKANPLTRQ